MSSGLKIDNVYIQVRDILQKDGIKLWQDPYYTTTGPSYDELEVHLILNHIPICCNIS